MVLFKQLTGIGSPGLYPRASSKLFIGSCPLNAAASEDQKAKSATVGSHDGACVTLVMVETMMKKVEED